MSDDKTITLTLPVLIPADLVPDGYEAARVQSGFVTCSNGESVVNMYGKVTGAPTYFEPRGDLQLIVRLKPTWRPPASLAPGEYRFVDGVFDTGLGLMLRGSDALNLFRDWTNPPREGFWDVNADGTAEYKGERR